MLRIVLMMSLLGCNTTEELVPNPCPICQEPSIAEIEVCEIEKAELIQKLNGCLDRLYDKKSKKGKR